MDLNELVSRFQADRSWAAALRRRASMIASADQTARLEDELGKLVVREQSQSRIAEHDARGRTRAVKLADQLTVRADGATAPVAARLLARAAELLRGIDPVRFETALIRAFLLDPLREEVAVLLEDHLASEHRLDQLLNWEQCALNEFARTTVRAAYLSASPCAGFVGCRVQTSRSPT